MAEHLYNAVHRIIDLHTELFPHSAGAPFGSPLCRVQLLELLDIALGDQSQGLFGHIGDDDVTGPGVTEQSGCPGQSLGLTDRETYGVEQFTEILGSRSHVVHPAHL
ncbi:hypothetical protein [Nesterenkonia lutea]|uniref:Uncharacterized protein n=1 Tax=Nesterenkonia lutea TaxID=272919 RepID=A0ABR9JG86_9MICC|nr:hypothetical protein [Nesterenkonia lutea]MBE1524945.1 hypothetical protein [Nesterenkonia lutea]